ncbi:hypothetical protein Pst134EA_013480 [Puccinia striiformis f. sp. tritici]|nr:hypothetical protein Pst134EA_013480 [Puccinia striiformis f. sp. tritici]KAH9465599.1 hypothetical protein Pst134EA_013480 [Puccinia striiformis f. sp. tritici]
MVNMLATSWFFIVVHISLTSVCGSDTQELSLITGKDSAVTWRISPRETLTEEDHATFTHTSPADSEPQSDQRTPKRQSRRSISRSEPLVSLRKVQISTRIALDVEPQSETYVNAKILYSYTPDDNQAEDSFNDTAQMVLKVLDRVATHSWEYGAQSEVLLELHYQDLSVYSTTRKLPLSEEDGPIPTPQSLLDLIDPILARRDPNILPLVEGDGSAGDPASLGIAVLVASAATANDSARSENYRKLAEGQLDWSMNHVPRCPEGAISQRNDEVQFWADFMYMLPPFLAYYGAATSNITLLQSAYDQVRLYRQKLQTSSDTKLWSHIIGGSYEDRLYWSTGNGWAAAGMMRVYATFNNLRDPGLFAQTETWRHDLAEWVLEITTAAFTHQQLDTELIPNYMLTTDPKRNYPDCSGTALIASAAYRLASLEPSYVSQLPMNAMAKSRIAIFSKYTNITTGAVGPVVDPMDWNAEKAFNGSKAEVGHVSPEGQALVLLLYAAWNSYSSPQPSVI